MSATGALARSEWRARRRTYVLLFVLVGGSACAYALVVAFVGGFEARVGTELSDTLGGDVRVSRGATAIASGLLVAQPDETVAALRFSDPGARAAPRLEAEGLFLHGADYTSARTDLNVTATAGILAGIDPVTDAAVVPLAPYVTEGHALGAPGDDHETLPNGEPLVPIVVGRSLLETTNLTVSNGSFSWSSVVNVTTGRIENRQIVRIHAVVVGAYETGFRMIDRIIVYAPRGEVARLLAESPDDPPANVFVVRAPHPETVAAAANADGYRALTAREFRETYIGPVFAALRTVTWGVVVVLSVITAGWIAHALAGHVAGDRRKIATLRAIGVPTADFAWLYLGAGAALGAVGGVAGAALAAVAGLSVSALSARGGPLDALGPVALSASAASLAAVVALSTGVATVAALVALVRIRRLEVREALRAP
ncbi:MAG: FtsX-like permease family protein [Thermoplasmatota archaeon]